MVIEESFSFYFQNLLIEILGFIFYRFNRNIPFRYYNNNKKNDANTKENIFSKNSGILNKNKYLILDCKIDNFFNAIN